LIIDVRPKSPAGGRLKWGNSGLNSQSPPRKWKSMLDVTDGKLTSPRTSSPAKSSSPKTPMTVDGALRSGSNHRPSSPSPLRYGIGILSRVLCDASWCFRYDAGGLKGTAGGFLCTTEPFLVLFHFFSELHLWCLGLIHGNICQRQCCSSKTIQYRADYVEFLAVRALQK